MNQHNNDSSKINTSSANIHQSDNIHQEQDDVQYQENKKEKEKPISNNSNNLKQLNHSNTEEDDYDEKYDSLQIPGLPEHSFNKKILNHNIEKEYQQQISQAQKYNHKLKQYYKTLDTLHDINLQLFSTSEKIKIPSGKTDEIVIPEITEYWREQAQQRSVDEWKKQSYPLINQGLLIIDQFRPIKEMFSEITETRSHERKLNQQIVVCQRKEHLTKEYYRLVERDLKKFMKTKSQLQNELFSNPLDGKDSDHKVNSFVQSLESLSLNRNEKPSEETTTTTNTDFQTLVIPTEEEEDEQGLSIQDNTDATIVYYRSVLRQLAQTIWDNNKHRMKIEHELSQWQQRSQQLTIKIKERELESLANEIEIFDCLATFIDSSYVSKNSSLNQKENN